MRTQRAELSKFASRAAARQREHEDREALLQRRNGAGEHAITIDASGLQPFTPLFDIQIDRFVDEAGLPTKIGFPDGRRFGDDVRDRAAQFGRADAIGFGMRLQIIYGRQ